MRGGANNYRKGAPIVSRIGRGGFWMSGTVRRAGDGARPDTAPPACRPAARETVRGVVGKGTLLSDLYLQVRLGVARTACERYRLFTISRCVPCQYPRNSGSNGWYPATERSSRKVSKPV